MKQVYEQGKVWLVGAGPGDAELLTIKALRVIEGADLILFDQLVGKEIRALFPKSAPSFYVGKRKGQHSIAQKDLNALLVKKAREGKSVCRLKGGDPFVFGRGGEEMLALVNAGIEVEVVPGITAAAGCSASAGIPLTHRGLAQGCTFVTAHGEHELNLNWQALAALNHTLVFYMGVSRAELIRAELLRAGMAPSLPIAVVEKGCRPDQRVLVDTLHGLSQLVAEAEVQSPALIVVGEVVRLASRLNPQQWVAGLGLDRIRLTA